MSTRALCGDFELNHACVSSPHLRLTPREKNNSRNSHRHSTLQGPYSVRRDITPSHFPRVLHARTHHVWLQERALQKQPLRTRAQSSIKFVLLRGTCAAVALLLPKKQHMPLSVSLSLSLSLFLCVCAKFVPARDHVCEIGIVPVNGHVRENSTCCIIAEYVATSTFSVTCAALSMSCIPSISTCEP
jgi:hypothetical protein